MRSETLFISDLHLGPTRPALTRLFLNFLKQRASGAKALYILGDLFDLWVGDDDPFPPAKQVKAGLRRLVDSGTPVFFQPGNRDFLIGQDFLDESGVFMIEDHAVIELNGSRTLLMHGDLLCTDDHAYLQFRAKSHTPEWRQDTLAKPLWKRLAYGRWYRFRSFYHKLRKNDEIMDVNPQTVESVMRQYQVLRLIHGHTHRPAQHHLEVAGQAAQRFVLAQWERHGNVLTFDDQGFRAERVAG